MILWKLTIRCIYLKVKTQSNKNRDVKKFFLVMLTLFILFFLLWYFKAFDYSNPKVAFRENCCERFCGIYNSECHDFKHIKRDKLFCKFSDDYGASLVLEFKINNVSEVCDYEPKKSLSNA